MKKYITIIISCLFALNINAVTLKYTSPLDVTNIVNSAITTQVPTYVNDIATSVSTGVATSVATDTATTVATAIVASDTPAIVETAIDTRFAADPLYLTNSPNMILGHDPGYSIPRPLSGSGPWLYGFVGFSPNVWLGFGNNNGIVGTGESFYYFDGGFVDENSVVRFGDLGMLTATIDIGSHWYDESIPISPVWRTNSISITTNGYVTLNGDADFWTDLNVPASAMTIPSTGGPTLETVLSGTGLKLPGFAADSAQEVYFTAQLPFSYKEGTSIRPHIHWMPLGTSATGSVLWKLEYAWVNKNGQVTATTTVSVTRTGSGLVRYAQIAEFSDIVGTGKTKSSTLICRLYRDGADSADTYTDKAAVVSFGFQVNNDCMGSDNERDEQSSYDM